jgi:hypothetical protein
MADPLVEPLNPSAIPPEAQTPPVEPIQEPSAQVPEEIIQIPAMQAVFSGSPPAVSARIKEFARMEEAKLIAQNKDVLQQAGIGFYKALSGELGVIFNQFYIHPSDIQAADKQGKLLQIAPPIEQVDAAVAKAGANHPALARNSVPGGPAASRSASLPPQFSSGQPASASGSAPAPRTPSQGGSSQGAPAGLQRTLLKARLSALAPGAPTSGPSPGSGRLLNQILKPVV